MRERADHCLETHLTLRELRALRMELPYRTRIHVCENPRVVEAAADAGCGEPLICTSGSATTVVLTLLDALASAGCAFVYHGDFDGPGIMLANRVVERYGAEPWRMRTEDYEYLVTRAQAHGTPQYCSADRGQRRCGTRNWPRPWRHWESPSTRRRPSTCSWRISA
ncbi:LOW QUALITY PROTEIN: conserved hypothetical protein, partial [Streptomyces sviceus ATCC 29083]